MRIGHQIYNLLNEYSERGFFVLPDSIEFKPNNSDQVYKIVSANINWLEDQVYVSIMKGTEWIDYTIRDFLHFMGEKGTPGNYKPLYQLRDYLKKVMVKQYKERYGE